MEREQAVKFIYDLLRALLAKKGSDLFITAGFPPAMKIDSKMTPVSQTALTAQHTAMLVRAIMNDKQAAEFEAKKECNFAITPAGIGRFRVNCFIQMGQVGMVLRVITTSIPNFDDLKLPPVLKDVAHDQARPGAVRRRHRLGQVHLARGDDRLPQRELATATSSPSRTRSSTCTRTRTA